MAKTITFTSNEAELKDLLAQHDEIVAKISNFKLVSEPAITETAEEVSTPPVSETETAPEGTTV